MSAKLTPWISGDQKPARAGVYERKWKHGEPFVFPFYLWDGECWRGLGDRHAWEVPSNDAKVSCFQDFPWRGLASDPSKAAK